MTASGRLSTFRGQKTPHDARMDFALGWLLEKRRKDGYWYLENRHPGQVHFETEKVGEPSRFLTLKALYILSAGALYIHSPIERN